MTPLGAKVHVGVVAFALNVTHTDPNEVERGGVEREGERRGVEREGEGRGGERRGVEREGEGRGGERRENMRGEQSKVEQCRRWEEN